jgi:hypothetical protein
VTSWQVLRLALNAFGGSRSKCQKETCEKLFRFTEPILRWMDERTLFDGLFVDKYINGRKGELMVIDS